MKSTVVSIVSYIILPIGWLLFYWNVVRCYKPSSSQQQETTTFVSSADHSDPSQVIIKKEMLRGKQRPLSVLCFFNGDEGSTVLSEAMRLHSQVYSPDWGYEPVDSKKQILTLSEQLDAIRFLLRLPTKNMDNFDIDVKEPISKLEYNQMVGNATATYIKAAVCRKEHRNVNHWLECMEEALTNLMCGTDEETIDHLVLPVRYGFDRACSIYVHADKELYRTVSQFTSTKSDNNSNNNKVRSMDNLNVELSQDVAKRFKNKQQLYMEEFMLLKRLASGTCPNGKPRKTQIHVYDYDNAKKVGMDVELLKIFSEIGLDHDPQTVHLGRFGERKPGNYCERIFDKKSEELLWEQQREYEEWLESQCNADEDDLYPWCNKDGRNVAF